MNASYNIAAAAAAAMAADDRSVSSSSTSGSESSNNRNPTANATTTSQTDQRRSPSASSSYHAGTPPQTFIAAMKAANPNGTVDHVIRFRPLVGNETPSTWKTTVLPAQNRMQELVISTAAA